MLYFKPFEQIQVADIEQLKSDEITEGKYLEFKQDVPRDSKAFLETVVAFANSLGGVIVYGAKELRVGNEKTGKIEDICGIESATIDSTKARLENYLRDQVQPRLDCRIKELNLPNGKCVLIVKVNKGWHGPYYFRNQGIGLLFYRRAESQNILMDHTEIKSSFLSSDTTRDRLFKFSEKRTQEIITQQVPFKLEGEKLLIVHVLPLDSFREETFFSHERIDPLIASVGPISSSGYSARPNIDGIFQYWS
ncbi:MAG: helix-turn-helix domain-containing protein [Bdellovibrionales bacterium]